MAGQILYPPTGLIEGELLEDMVDTVVLTKRPFIDVHYPDWFDKDKPYPYTYVNATMMMLPLRKGRKILARFSQSSELYPEFVRFADEQWDDQFIKDDKKIQLPSSGELVQWPSTETTLSAIKLSEKSWIITASVSSKDGGGDDSEDIGYTIIHRNDQTILLGDDKLVIYTDHQGFLAKDYIHVETLEGNYEKLVAKDDLQETRGNRERAVKGNETVNITGNEQTSVTGTSKHTSANTDIESQAPVGIKGTGVLLGGGVLKPYWTDETAGWNQYPVFIPPVPWPPGVPVPPVPPLINMALNGLKAAYLQADAKAIAQCVLAQK